MRRRRMVVVAAVGVLAVSASVGAHRSYAQAPTQQGWWSSTNPGSVEGSPAPSPPPDVPPKGLLVEGGAGSTAGSGNGGPTAFAALVYELPMGATAVSLNLTVAPGSATTPTSELELCVLAEPAIPAEQGGPISDAPSFTCSHNESASPSSSGASYRFDVGSLVSNGTLAVAILPTSPLDRVVLAPPSEGSLAIEPSAPAPTTMTAGGGGMGANPATPGASAPDQASSSAPSAPAALSTGISPAGPAVALPAEPSASAGSGPALPPPTMAGAPLATAVRPSSTASTAVAFSADTPPNPGANPLAVALVVGALLLAAAVWAAVGAANVRSVRREADVAHG